MSQPFKTKRRHINKALKDTLSAIQHVTSFPVRKDKLNQASTRCAKSLLGVRRTASDCGLYHITGILPLTLRTAQVNANFYIKVACLSSDELEACALK
ncbi:hypothetical protein RvY_04991 [Ramazzottius varieornatus]|uniref:Uncharacterized protein n=1 Tax=Ramazzottius varieornatus TaxID=947166 RepID=A0A1D1V3G0_RAMVA|nr:hypothetical protein RvY_04991 [Ramazzottius varieornatus]